MNPVNTTEVVVADRQANKHTWHHHRNPSIRPMEQWNDGMGVGADGGYNRKDRVTNAHGTTPVTIKPKPVCGPVRAEVQLQLQVQV